MNQGLAQAVHAYLAGTASRLVVVQLEDVLVLTLEEIARDSRFLRLAAVLSRIRPRIGVSGAPVPRE